MRAKPLAFDKDVQKFLRNHGWRLTRRTGPYRVFAREGETLLIGVNVVAPCQATPGSLLDRLERAGLVGVADDLPHDLSTNRAYLEGLGA